MENGAFAPIYFPLRDNFKYIVFQRHQKALPWSKGLTLFLSLQTVQNLIFSSGSSLSKNLLRFPVYEGLIYCNLFKSVVSLNFRDSPFYAFYLQP